MNEGHDINNPKYMKGFIRRRKKIFFVVSCAILAGSILLSLVLPRAYVSTATILIEGQMTKDLLKGISMGFVEERLQVITQQILTRDKLLQLIKKHNLLTNLENPSSIDAAVDLIRKNIELKTIKSGDVDRRSYGPMQTTVAFTLSYSASDPLIAQKVASELTSLYVEKNIEGRDKLTSQASAVLKEKLNQLQEQVNIVERRMGDFKRSHANELPENLPYNLEQINRLNTQLEEVNNRIRILEETKSGSSGATVGVDSRVEIANQGAQRTNDPWSRLIQLRAQLVSLKSRYSDRHPDVMKTRREIQRLEKQMGISSENAEKENQLEELKNQYADLQLTLGSDHPDTVRLSERISALTSELEEDKKRVQRSGVKTVEGELQSYKRKRDEIKIKIDVLTRQSQMGPMVQREYNQLVQEYDNVMRQYNETMNRLTEAKVTKEIDDTQLGERFTVIEEPRVPQTAEKPKRKKIIFGGFLLALFGGFCAAIFTERMDQSIKSVDQLQKITNLPVLTVVYRIKTDEEEEAARKGDIFQRISGELKKTLFSTYDNLKKFRT